MLDYSNNKLLSLTKESHRVSLVSKVKVCVLPPGRCQDKDVKRLELFRFQRIRFSYTD